MLKDVGMTVPKSRETSAVYICSNTGDEGSIFISPHVMFIAAVFESSEPLHLLRLNGHVGAITT